MGASKVDLGSVLGDAIFIKNHRHFEVGNNEYGYAYADLIDVEGYTPIGISCAASVYSSHSFAGATFIEQGKIKVAFHRIAEGAIDFSVWVMYAKDELVNQNSSPF